MRESVAQGSESSFRPLGLAVDAAGVACFGGGARPDADSSIERFVVYRIEPDGDPTQFWMPGGPTSGALTNISDVAAFAGGKTIATWKPKASASTARR